MFGEGICQSGAQLKKQIHPRQRACTGVVVTGTHLTARIADRQNFNLSEG